MRNPEVKWNEKELQKFEKDYGTHNNKHRKKVKRQDERERAQILRIEK